MLIRFISHCGIYMPGDVAGFEDADAARYVRARAAVPADEVAIAPVDEVSAVKVEHPVVPQESRRKRK